MTPCLAEDDLLELARGRALGAGSPAEAHLADCPACSALLAALLDGPGEGDRWGALVGKTLGPYRLEAQIGAGGMGAVYRAWDDRLRRNVAVKVLPPHAAGTAEQAHRLANEARAAAAIAHPSVVTIYDVGRDGDVAYVVQELVEGESLRSVLGRGALPPARALRIGLELARGLAAAHAQGVVHRDLKPENILLGEDGTPKILDFGLAKLAADGDPDITEPGTVQGTAGYMSPEQARGEPVDARCDLFALGAILYELHTGRRAFDGASHAERLSAVLRDTPAMDDAGALAPILLRCLDKDPRRRFQSAADLAWTLEGLLEARAPAPRAAGASRRGVLAGLGAAAAGAAGFGLARFLDRRAGPPRVPKFRQLTFRHGRVMDARFAPDGGSLLYGAAWEAEPLTAFILRLDGGAARPLDVPPADVLAVSSRGEVALCLGRRHVEAQSVRGRLAVAPIDGGAPRALVDDVQDADFTPDGRELAIVRPGGRGFRLELPADRVLYETDGWITHARVSPDGGRVAFLLHPETNDDRGDVVVVERATGKARALTTDWDSAAGLAWDPRGDSLWLTAARVGANSAVHIVGMDRELRMVAQNTERLRLHDIAADRRLAVSVDTWRLRTVVGLPGAPIGAERDRSMSDFSLVADISADGATLLVGEFGDVDAARGAYLRPIEGGAPLRVGVGRPIALSPAGDRVAAILPGETPPLIIHLTASAEHPAMNLGPIASVSSGRWIDEERLVVTAAAAGREPRLWLLTLGTPPPVPLTDEGDFGRCELDGERRRLAFIGREGRLSVIDVGDGATRVLPGSYPGHVVCGWLANPESIAVRTRTTPLVLRRVDPATGAASPYLEIAPPPLGLRAVDSLVIRRDGSLFAYSYGQELSQLYLVTL